MNRRKFLSGISAVAAGTLAARGAGRAQEAGGMPVLEGVPPLAWRRGRQCSFIGSLEAVLRYHGEPYDYVDLMGLSGAAFRIRIAYPSSDRIMGGRIHPGISVDATFGPHIDWLKAATGYEFEVDAHVFHGEGGEEPIAERIEGEIDAKRPVIAINLQGASQWGVIAGYDTATPRKGDGGEYQGQRYLCRTYYDPEGSDYIPAPHFPWDIHLVRRAGEPLVEEEAAWTSVQNAVALLRTETGRVSRPSAWMWFFREDYVNGIAAYDAWVGDLQDEAGIGSLTPEQYLMYWQGHAWMYDALHDARRAAAQYLRRIEPRFRARERELIGEAARAYEDLVGHLTGNWDCIPFCDAGYIEPQTGWWIRVEHDDFMGRQIPSYASEWTSEMRQQAIDVLNAAREKEEEALALLAELV